MTERQHTPDSGRARPPGGHRTGASRTGTYSQTSLQAHRLGDDASGALLFFMLVFGPWAFGTTQPWAIHCMTAAGLALGGLLLLKLFIRHVRAFPAARWENYSPRTGTLSRREPAFPRRLKKILAWLTVAFLAECLVSAWNAAAWYTPETRVFHYQAHLDWLPHSFDAGRSWAWFWKYLGLAAAFWAAVDWLGGLTPAEERALPGLAGQPPPLPARWRALLWLLALNGTILALECILQRESGTDKLLFVLTPHLNQGGVSQFGPYAYRSNAAQYFNLIWPLTLGFWLALHRAARGRPGPHHALLASAALMAACPIISTSRGGALVSAGMLLLTLAFLAFAARRTATADQLAPASPGRPATGPLVLCLGTALLLGLGFGWHALAPRMEQIGEGYDGRQALYAAAAPMARDYPLYGTGPGTYATVFQLYRFSEKISWNEQVHDDWLETRITFGWLGLVLLLAALALTVLRGFLPGGVRGQPSLATFAWLALGGCLVEARYDFPFQVHSTLFMFLLLCALLLNLGRGSVVSDR